jgi:hypothetical protein
MERNWTSKYKGLMPVLAHFLHLLQLTFAVPGGCAIQKSRDA